MKPTFDEVLFPKDAPPVDPNRPVAHAKRTKSEVPGVLCGLAMLTVGLVGLAAALAYITYLVGLL